MIIDDLAQEIDPVDPVLCPHCGTKNSKKSYGCISCLKVMFPKKKNRFNIEIRPSVAFVVVLMVFSVAAFNVLKKWLQLAETNVTINAETAQYNMIMVQEQQKGRYHSADERELADVASQ